MGQIIKPWIEPFQDHMPIDWKMLSKSYSPRVQNNKWVGGLFRPFVIDEKWRDKIFLIEYFVGNPMEAIIPRFYIVIRIEGGSSVYCALSAAHRGRGGVTRQTSRIIMVDKTHWGRPNGLFIVYAKLIIISECIHQSSGQVNLWFRRLLPYAGGPLLLSERRRRPSSRNLCPAKSAQIKTTQLKHVIFRVTTTELTGPPFDQIEDGTRRRRTFN